jgi:CHAD domain-containing protein
MVQRAFRTPRAAFRHALCAALARIEANARGMLRSGDPQYLHQLRVGLRRLRSALRAFRELLDRKEVKAVVRPLRRLSPKLGAARDWDVLMGRLGGKAEPFRPEHDHARERARRAVRSKDFRHVVARARALHVKDTGKSLAQFGAAALERAHRKLRKLEPDFAEPAARHALRIRVKRLRYSVEFFAPAFPRAKPYLADLQALQEILGELNDIAVGRRLAGFEADERALLRKLGAAWARFEKREPFW